MTDEGRGTHLEQNVKKKQCFVSGQEMWPYKHSLSKATEREREVVTDSIARSVLNNVINDKILPLGCSI